MNTLHVANFDDFFVKRPVLSSATAGKCRRLGPQAIALAKKPGDMVLLYEEPDLAHIDYLDKTVYNGGLPTLVWPSQLTNPLSLAHSAMNDANLIGLLRRFVGRVSPLISTPDIFHLAEGAGLQVSGTPRGKVFDDVVAKANQKHIFWRRAQTHGIQVPNSQICDWDALPRCIARLIMSGEASVMVRQSQSAGGLGNLKVRCHELPDTSPEGVERYLISVLSPEAIENEWKPQPAILVEPVLEVIRSVATMIVLNDSGADERTFSIVERRIANQSESYGAVFPVRNLKAADMAWLREKTLDYASTMWEQGYRGGLDIDFDQLPDSSWTAFESNARDTAIARTLGHRDRFGRSEGVAGSCDYLRVGRSVSLQDVIRALKRRELLWSHGRSHKGGIIITLPPKNGAMAYTCLARDHAALLRMDEVMMRLSQASLEAERAA